MTNIIDKYFQSLQSRHLSDDRYMQFHDRDFAYSYLLKHLHDSFSMMSIRELLADQLFDTSRMTDHQVLQEFASCLVIGTVQIAIKRNQLPLQTSAAISETQENIDDSESISSARIDDEFVPIEQKTIEPDEWVVTVTPAMLVAAAKDGIPFCEECARAAQANAQ